MRSNNEKVTKILLTNEREVEIILPNKKNKKDYTNKWKGKFPKSFATVIPREKMG